MKLYIYYILIALLTFGFATFLVYVFYFSNFNFEKKIVKTQNKKVKIESKFNKNVVKADESIKQIETLECESNTEIINLKPILKEWLKGRKFESVPYCAETVKKANSYSHYNATPTLIDVNSDGTDEIALQHGCSPTGNCEFEVFVKTKKGYRRILNAVRDVNLFKLENSSIKSYQNIKTTMHGSCCSGDGIIYKYNGKTYKPERCFFYEYKIKKETSEEVSFKNKPQITFTKCSTFF